MVRDVVQLIFWAVFGFFLSWGIFLAYLGFRKEHKPAAVLCLTVEVIWIVFWVCAVIFNTIQIAGGTPWPLHQP